ACLPRLASTTAPAPPSLHDALPISVPQNDYTLTVQWPASVTGEPGGTASVDLVCHTIDALGCSTVDTENFADLRAALSHTLALRSEEHTSELQSRENLVCRLLLEKK